MGSIVVWSGSVLCYWYRLLLVSLPSWPCKVLLMCRWVGLPLPCCRCQSHLSAVGCIIFHACLRITTLISCWRNLVLCILASFLCTALSPTSLSLLICSFLFRIVHAPFMKVASICLIVRRHRSGSSTYSCGWGVVNIQCSMLSIRSWDKIPSNNCSHLTCAIAIAWQIFAKLL